MMIDDVPLGRLWPVFAILVFLLLAVQMAQNPALLWLFVLLTLALLLMMLTLGAVITSISIPHFFNRSILIILGISLLTLPILLHDSGFEANVRIGLSVACAVSIILTFIQFREVFEGTFKQYAPLVVAALVLFSTLVVHSIVQNMDLLLNGGFLVGLFFGEYMRWLKRTGRLKRASSEELQGF